MIDVTVWHNARCSSSRGACGLLEGQGVNATVVRYLETPPDRAEIARPPERLLALLV